MDGFTTALIVSFIAVSLSVSTGGCYESLRWWKRRKAVKWPDDSPVEWFGGYGVSIADIEKQKGSK